MRYFSEIYKEYYPKLLRFACDFIPCKEDAENLLQDAFMELWKNNDRIHEIKNINAYMFRFVRNRCLDYLKHKVHERAYEEAVTVERKAALDTLDMMGDTDLMAGELTMVLKQAIGNLPPRCREIFLLSREEGLRYSEIAERLSLSENTVSVQLGIALRRLRAVVETYMSK